MANRILTKNEWMASLAEYCRVFNEAIKEVPEDSSLLDEADRFAGLISENV